jgi:hypothetical protein
MSEYKNQISDLKNEIEVMTTKNNNLSLRINSDSAEYKAKLEDLNRAKGNSASKEKDIESLKQIEELKAEKAVLKNNF